MATLSGKSGTWTLPHVHMWKDRQVEYLANKAPLIHPNTRIATIGSCFAEELAKAMTRLGLDGKMHPSGLFYDTKSIRQEIERIAGDDGGRSKEPLWKVPSGFAHPFKDLKQTFATEQELRAWSDAQDREADQLFKNADVVVMTLGLIEAWRNPKTGHMYRQIPHPAVFPTLGAEFHRLTTREMRDDLEAILAALRKITKAEVVITVSPIPLHATLTDKDVRIANTESKSRIRAVVSELIEDHPEVHYFHSYELVTTAERLSDFMVEDGRHVNKNAVDYILNRFLATFAGPGVPVATVDTSWLTAPEKTAERAVSEHSIRGHLTAAVSEVGRRIPKILGGS